MSDLKERIKKELELIFSEKEEVIGFFSFTISKTSQDKPIATVTWICDKANFEQGNEISKKLMDLADAIKPFLSI